MIPLIIVSNQIEKQEEYIKKFILDNSVRTYNIYNIRAVKTEITIDQIRSIKTAIITQSNEMRLFICYAFDNANLEAQNAFLKTLEEKQAQNFFLLLVHNPERVIPTIRSRSKIVLLDSAQEHTIIRKQSQAFFDGLKTSTGYAFLADPVVANINREDAELFIDEFIHYLRGKLRENKKNAVDVIKKSFQVKQLLQSNNLNPQLSVDSLLIYLKKSS